MLTLRALRAGRAFTESEPTSDAHCRVSNTASPAPAALQQGMIPRGINRTFIRVTRLVPRAPCLRATRFPSQSTFCRDRNSPSLAAMLCRDACSEGIPSKTAPRAPVHPISAARVLTNPAASFGLDTLLVRALSSSHLSDARMLPSDVCHPIHLYPSAPALSTLTRLLELALESREE